MGVMVHALIIFPYRRWMHRRNVAWQVRKNAGEQVFPLKPGVTAVLSLIVVVYLGMVIFG